MGLVHSHEIKREKKEFLQAEGQINSQLSFFKG